MSYKFLNIFINFAISLSTLLNLKIIIKSAKKKYLQKFTNDWESENANFELQEHMSEID